MLSKVSTSFSNSIQAQLGERAAVRTNGFVVVADSKLPLESAVVGMLVQYSVFDFTRSWVCCGVQIAQWIVKVALKRFVKLPYLGSFS